MSKLIVSKCCLAALVAASVASVASAQKRQETKPVPTDKDKTEQREDGQQSSYSDENVSRMLAACVAMSNQHELAMCQFAIDHIQNPEVKQFTEMLIEEHTQCAKKLAPFAPAAASVKFDGTAENRRTTSPAGSKIQQTSGKDAADPKRKDVANAVARESVTTTQDGPQNEDRLISIERQVAEECLSLKMKELTEAKEAGNFDEAFLSCQIGAHLGMMAKLSVYEGVADGELAQLFSEGRKTTEKHFGQAKKLMTTVGKEK